MHSRNTAIPEKREMLFISENNRKYVQVVSANIRKNRSARRSSECFDLSFETLKVPIFYLQLISNAGFGLEDLSNFSCELIVDVHEDLDPVHDTHFHRIDIAV